MRDTPILTIAERADGELLQGRPEDRFERISTDTRKLQGGEVFVALKGERYDAHDYLRQAVEAGAGALMVHRLPKETEEFELPIVRVHDTLRGLQSLAWNERRTWTIPVIGITGSSGKTSTKDLLRSMMRQRFCVNATEGNLNNHIGVPLTLLRTDADHTAAVVEMGMNHAGEIEVLAEIARPTGAIVTNVGSAHLENLGSREAIAEEKGMLAEAVEADGFVVLPAADDFRESIAARCRARVVTGGIGCGDVRAEEVELAEEEARFVLCVGEEREAMRLGLPAEHMVQNATLAAAVARELGLTLAEIAQGIEAVEWTGARLQRKYLDGVTFLDDSYNANPESVRAALRALAKIPVSGRRIAVLGRMAELGERSAVEHEAVGRAAAENGIDILVGIGDEGELLARGAESQVKTHVFDDQKAAAAFLRSETGPDDLVLVKGSRSAEMELVLLHFTRET